MNKNLFLSCDVKDALAEYKAARSCNFRIEECLINGDLREAKLTLKDLSKSIREIEMLQEKKRRNDEFATVVHQLAEQGILDKIGAII